MTECACRCGQVVKPGNRFVSGHNVRVNHPMKDPESRRKVSESLKRRPKKYKLYNITTKCACGCGEFVSRPNNKYVSGHNAREGNKNTFWKGGSSIYWHNEAWKLFGKDKCERCGINNDYYIQLYKRRLDMHNTLNPKDYSVMESEAWLCVCAKCHKRLEG